MCVYFVRQSSCRLESREHVQICFKLLFSPFLFTGGDKVLLDFRQESPGDHVALADVLKALGIDEPVPPPPVAGAGGDAAGGASAGGAAEGESKDTKEESKDTTEESKDTTEKKVECNDDVCQIK